MAQALPASGRIILALDTTDPATIQVLQQSLPLTHTLFIVASKSGATLETISQFKYFYERVRQFAVGAAAEAEEVVHADHAPLGLFRIQPG